jgi:hypothetical protein
VPTQLSGFTARLFSCQDVCNRAAYGVQSVLLVLGPTLFMFSVNWTQTTFVRALHADNICWVPVALQKWFYLGINIILIIPQSIGGIVTVSSTSIPAITTASKVTIAIYVIQTVFWGFTFAENIYMSVRLRRHPTEESLHRLRNWTYWNQLFGLSVSIIGFGRNGMRLTMSGGIAFLIENEWPSYAFDGYQMVVIMSAWVVFNLPEKCEDSTFNYCEASRLKSLILDSYVSLPNHINHEAPSEIPAPLERLEKFVSDLAEWEIVLLSRLRWEYDPSPFFGVSRLLLRFFAKHELIQLKICKYIWENHTCRPMKASELADFRCNLLSLRASLDHAGLESHAHRT